MRLRRGNGGQYESKHGAQRMESHGVSSGSCFLWREFSRPPLTPPRHVQADRTTTKSVNPHRQALQAQLADGAAIDRREVRIGHVRLRKARQQAADRDGDGGAAEDVADAVMRAGAEGQNAFGLAMDVEAERIGELID